MRRPREGRYYDLVRVPHGHIPVPKVNMWSGFPIPVREIRGYDYYHCPNCGQPSFFKVNVMCRYCEDDASYDYASDGEQEEAMSRIYRLRSRRNYFREIWKRLEYLILPVLVLLGQSWYVEARRFVPSVKKFSPNNTLRRFMN